jgi:restriction system protein
VLKALELVEHYTKTVNNTLNPHEFYPTYELLIDLCQEMSCSPTAIILMRRNAALNNFFKDVDIRTRSTEAFIKRAINDINSRNKDGDINVAIDELKCFTEAVGQYDDSMLCGSQHESITKMMEYYEKKLPPAEPLPPRKAKPEPLLINPHPKPKLQKWGFRDTDGNVVPKNESKREMKSIKATPNIITREELERMRGETTEEIDSTMATDENHYDNMDGTEFEIFCTEVLSANGFVNIERKGASGDHGVDILAEKDGITYAVQCKRSAENIGNKAVQEVYLGKDFYRQDIAVVLTNQFFTPNAKEAAKRTGVKLWDREHLKRMIESMQAKQ